MGYQPLTIAPLVHIGVAGVDRLSVLELEGVGTKVLRDVASDLDRAGVATRLVLPATFTPKPESPAKKPLLLVPMQS